MAPKCKDADAFEIPSNKKAKSMGPKDCSVKVQEGQTVTAGGAGGRTPYHRCDADLIGSQRTNIKGLWRRVPPEKSLWG